ncbi:hypothetical protein BJX76DRAFT_305702 [Aspergillus varians]
MAHPSPAPRRSDINRYFSISPASSKVPRQKEDQPFGPASGPNSVRREWTQQSSRIQLTSFARHPGQRAELFTMACHYLLAER